MQVHNFQTKASLTWASQNNIEVQTVDTNGGVVLDTQINVLLNTKTKVSSVTEVVLPQLVFSDFQAPFKDLLCLGSSHCAMDSDLFVTTDTERSHSVAGLGEDGLLASQLLQHLIISRVSQ